jgi:hypothetical protein
MRSAWIPFSLLAFACYGYYDLPNSDEGVSVEMMSHSFNSPFHYDSSSANWFLAGATIPVKNYRSSVILNPHIINRHGYLMNTKILKSRNFDVTFMLHMDNGGGVRSNQTFSPPRDQTFSIWFTEQDMSSVVESALSKNLQSDSPDYKKSLVSSRIDVMTGISARFKGVGIVITPTNARGESIPTVSVIDSNGRNDIIGASMFPSPSGTPLFPDSTSASLVHQLVYMRMKIKIRPDSIGLYMQDKADWRLVKELKTDNIPAMNGGGFFGVTSFTGSSVSATNTIIPYRIRITSVHIKTFDLNALNTEDNDAVLKLFRDQELSISDLVSESAFATTYSQTVVLKKLMKVVEGYIKQSAPALKSFESTISQMLLDKMNDLEGQLNVLSRETKLAFKERGNVGSKDEIFSQVRSIHDALKQSQADKLDVLSQIKSTANVEDHGNSIDRHVGYYERQIDSRNRELNDAIESENRFTLILFLVVFVSALVMGVVLYIRLNAYAQKAHLF